MFILMLTPRVEESKPRLLPHRLKWRRSHNAVYWFDLKLAHLANDCKRHRSARIHAPQTAWSRWLEGIGTTLKQKCCTKKKLVAELVSIETPRKFVRLVPKVDQRFHDVPQAEVQNDQARKGLIRNLTRLVLNHPENKKLMDELFIIHDGTRILPVRTSICTDVQKSTNSKPSILTQKVAVTSSLFMI